MGKLDRRPRRLPHQEPRWRRIQPGERENPNEAVTTQSIPAWDGGEGGLPRGEEGEGRRRGKGTKNKRIRKMKVSRGGKEKD